MLIYSPRYDIDIGAHVFPTRKYAMVQAVLRTRGHLAWAEPEAVSWGDLQLVHTRGYLTKLRTGHLSVTEQAQLEIPWSHEVTEGFRLMSGGTVTAARLALESGAALNMGGGFHHAFADHGEGFCMFNDVALAIRQLTVEGEIRCAAIVDCDVHHGNGTARIFETDARVFTFSIHQEHNYPPVKPASDLDIGLPDGVDDSTYLRCLDAVLPRVMAHQPDVVFYLAGADPYHDDQLGGLALSHDGLRHRDRRVFEVVRRAGCPVVVTLAGGYARQLDDTVAIHVATAEELFDT